MGRAVRRFEGELGMSGCLGFRNSSFGFESRIRLRGFSGAKIVQCSVYLGEKEKDDTLKF